MGAEGELEPAGQQRWAAFLTYAHDDNAEYISDFYQVFSRELKRFGITKQSYLDERQRDKAGDVARYLEQHARRADFLIIFVGDHYPSREFCLLEWEAFRSEFAGGEVRERLFIIEIDKGALEALRQVPLPGKESVAKERAADLAACFHEKFWQDSGRLISKRTDGGLDQSFEKKVEQVAEVFANQYRKLGPPPPRLIPSAQPEWVGPNDVLIGPWLEDMKDEIDALCKVIRERGKNCARLPNWAGIGDADQVLLEKMRVAVSAAPYFVQPYSIEHAEIQPPRRAHFDFFKESRASLPTLYWRPLGDGVRPSPGADAIREIEAHWSGAREWVGQRLKEIEGSAIVGPPSKILDLLERPSPLPSGPRIVLGGILKREADFDETVRLDEFAAGVQRFLAEFWARECEGATRSKINIEVQTVEGFLKLRPELVRQYSGIVILNRFTEEDSLKAQMEQIERAIEEHGHGRQFEFRVFICIPPPPATLRQGRWQPIIFDLNGTVENGFHPGKYQVDALKNFLTDVARHAC
jgi:hypothetical protein